MCGNRGKMKSTNFSNNEKLELVNLARKKLLIPNRKICKQISEDCWILHVNKIRDEIYNQIFLVWSNERNLEENNE
jgi:hypothetical protein